LIVSMVFSFNFGFRASKPRSKFLWKIIFLIVFVGI
jgi:hypothetical protein